MAGLARGASIAIAIPIAILRMTAIRLLLEAHVRATPWNSTAGLHGHDRCLLAAAGFRQREHELHEAQRPLGPEVIVVDPEPPAVVPRARSRSISRIDRVSMAISPPPDAWLPNTSRYSDNPGSNPRISPSRVRLSFISCDSGGRMMTIATSSGDLFSTRNERPPAAWILRMSDTIS